MKRDDDYAERTDAFLADLRRITIRHGIAISGCGCCGSPMLFDASKAKKKNARDRYRVDAGFDNLEWE